MTTTPLLTVEGVSKTFGQGTTALGDLTLEVRQGDFISLLGPSGCGKSTALRLMAGLMSPTTGRLRWQAGQGHGPESGANPPPESRPELGIVFQEPTLMPWSTVAQNVFLPLRLKGVGEIDAAPAVAEALRLVGLDGFGDAFPRELSGGMKMRVSIARAMVTRPRLILMDEPFAALDEITRFRLNNDLLGMKETLGCTVIFVTHSVFESVFLSDRILVMAARPGRVIDEIAVDEPYPRAEAFRTSAVYAAQCRAVSTALHRAMEPV